MSHDTPSPSPARPGSAAPVPGTGRAVLAALAGALALVFPSWCVGCDAPDETLCPACRDMLSPRVTERTVGGLSVYSGLRFDGVCARVVRAYKEEGRTAFADPLARALSAASTEALDSLDALRSSAGVGGRVAVVPVPTSRAAMRRRGYRVVELLATRAGLRPQRLLVRGGSAVDQRRLGAAERARNVAGSMRLDARARAGLDGRAVLLVDDVVTTGATLREAARVLTAAGAVVVGAATVASTPRTGEHEVTDT